MEDGREGKGRLLRLAGGKQTEHVLNRQTATA